MNRLHVVIGWTALAAGMALAGFIDTAAAGSKAVQWLINEQIKEGCMDNGKGQFAPGAVVERDLTGDGKDDLIISHEGLKCGNGGRSGFCGIRSCLVLIYVREGDLLTKKMEVLSIQVSVGAGSPPPINLVTDSGKEYAVRWDGRAFE